MKLCKNCAPCCDYCKYVIHDEWEDQYGLYKGPPIGCFLWNDEEHQIIAEDCGYCKDFCCINA